MKSTFTPGQILPRQKDTLDVKKRRACISQNRTFPYLKSGMELSVSRPSKWLKKGVRATTGGLVPENRFCPSETGTAVNRHAVIFFLWYRASVGHEGYCPQRARI